MASSNQRYLLLQDTGRKFYPGEEDVATQVDKMRNRLSK